jgi:hypothetical protein
MCLQKFKGACERRSHARAFYQCLVKPMFSCGQHCNIVPQYCNFDRQIAQEQFAIDANKVQVKIHKRFVNKASEGEAPIQLLRLLDWLPSFL